MSDTPLIRDYMTEEIWQLPWAKEQDSVYLQAFLLSDGETVAVKHKISEEDNTEELIEGLDVVASTDKILISPVHGKPVIHDISISSSVYAEPPYVKIHHELVSFTEAAKTAASKAKWKAGLACGKIAEKAGEFMHRDNLYIQFREVTPEYYEKRLYITECPVCYRQIVLEDHGGSGLGGSNLIVWLEGQYMATHEHAENIEEAEDFALDILSYHLRKSKCQPEIEMDIRYIDEKTPDTEWYFDAERDKQGNLKVKCQICSNKIYLSKNNTLRKAADWYVNHVCTGNSGSDFLRKDYHVI